MKIFKKIIAVFLVVLTLISFAPMSEIAEFDFKNAFTVTANAISDFFTPNYSLGVIRADSLARTDNKSKDVLSTQATGSATLTIGDSVDLYIAVKDKEGNDANVGDFPAISWSASPSAAVSLSVGSDTRNCTVKVISAEYSTVTITAKMGNQSASFIVNISGLTFDMPKYYILEGETELVSSLSSWFSSTCHAIWTCGEDSTYDPASYTFASSDESILSVNGGKYTESSTKVFYYPSVKGVKEGETTLTITAPDGATATCEVVVVAYKDYKVEIFSEELEVPVSDAEIEYKINREGTLSSQATVTVKTNVDGIATITLPDVKYVTPESISISADFHDDDVVASIDVEAFKEDSVNRCKINMAEIEVDSLSMDNQTVNGPSVEVFGENITTFNFDITGQISMGNAQVEVETSTKTVQVLIGFKDFDESANIGPDGNKTKYWSESYKEVKNLYQKVTGKKVDTTKLWNDFSKLRGKLKKVNGSMGINVSASIAGFIELSWASGKLKFMEGGIIAEASAGAEFNFNFPVPFPAYATFGLTGSVEGKISVSRDEDDAFCIGGEASASLTAKLGVGVGEKKATKTYIEGGLTGTITLSFKINRKSSWNLILSGSLYLKGELVGFDILDKTWPFPNYQLYPRNKMGTNALSTISYYDALLYAEPISRYYLDLRSALQTNADSDELHSEYVYPYTDPKLIDLGGGKRMLLWIDDLGDKNTVNKTTLLYRICNNGSWSDTKAIFDIGTYNDSPEVYVENGKVHILWQRSNKILAENAGINDLLSSMDLYYSCFDGSDFSAPVNLTSANNTVYEVSQSISVLNGKIIVTWVENSDNNIFMNDGTNTLKYKVYNGTSWNSTQTVYSGTASIDDLVVGWSDNNAVVLYVVDSELHLYNGSNDSVIVSSGETVSNLTVKDNKCYYLDNYSLRSIDLTSKVTETVVEGYLVNYEFVSNGENTILLSLISDGYTNELFGAEYKDGAFGKSYQITNYDSYIRSYSAILNSDGELEIAANVVDVLPSENGLYGDATLIVEKEKAYVNLSIGENAYYDYDKVIPGENLPISFDVVNNSKNMVNEFAVIISDESGNILEEYNIYKELAPGISTEVTVHYELPYNLVKHDINVSVVIEDDGNSDDNSFITTIGYANIIISECIINDNKLKAVVSNDGYDLIENAIAYVYDDLGNEIYKEVIGNMEALSNFEIEVFLDKDVLVSDHHLKDRQIKLVVESDSIESWYSDNEVVSLISAVRVTSMNFASNNVLMAVNDTIPLEINFIPSNASNKNAYWSVDDESIVEIDENGNITAKSKGTTIVRAMSCDGYYKDQCVVTVSDNVPVTGVKISNSQFALKIGDKLKLTADILPVNATNKDLIWKSENKKIAVVTDEGLVTAVSTGTTSIIVETVEGGYTATCQITVLENMVAVTEISISPKNAELSIGDNLQLDVNIIPANATNKNIDWFSSEESVVTVDASGMITAIEEGTAIVTVIVNDEFVDECTVVVSAKSIEKEIKSISVASNPQKMSYNYRTKAIDKRGMSIKVEYNDGSSEVISDISQFTVSEIPKKAKGNVILDVEYGGFKTSITVNVSYSIFQWFIVIVLFGWLWY